MKKKIIVIPVIMMILSSSQEMKVPIDLQVQLFMKILTFDRNLRARVGDEVVIGIIYQEKFRQSLNTKEEFLSAMDEFTQTELQGIPVRCIPIELHGETELEDSLSVHDLDILYLTPLRTIDIKKISLISRRKKILTLTGVPEYIEFGVAVSLGIREMKPKILINLTVAKEEGSDFSSRLLNLAEVTQ